MHASDKPTADRRQRSPSARNPEPDRRQRDADRRQQTFQSVAKLQNQRNELWSLYCKFATLKPFPANTTVKKQLDNFSQMLIDYISLGHFGVYDRLLAGKERRDSILTIAKEIYPEIETTTEIAISFNDKYEATNKLSSLEELESDLSLLGENLAKRIELEDQFFKLMAN